MKEGSLWEHYSHSRLVDEKTVSALAIGQLLAGLARRIENPAGSGLESSRKARGKGRKNDKE